METRSNPQEIFKELEANFHSITQFDELVRSSALYYQKHGSLNLLKIFIPSRNKDNEGHVYLNDWDLEKAEQAIKDIVKFFSTHGIADSYTTESQDDGVYLAMTTNTSPFLTFTRYLAEASYVMDKGRQNGVILTATEWLRDFPYEFHAAWWNRRCFSKTISAYLIDPGYELFAKALYDGRQNWLEDTKYTKIEKWNPKSDFTTVYTWKFNDTLEEKEQMLLEFKQNYQ